MPYYHQIGAEGFYTQLDAETFHRCGMNYYLAAKLAWNNRLDVDALMSDYSQQAFGPDAEPMLAYFQRLERTMIEADRCLSYGLESPRRWGPKVFTAPVMQEAGALMERALAAAPEEPYRQRVAFFQKGFNEARQALEKMTSK